MITAMIMAIMCITDINLQQMIMFVLMAVCIGTGMSTSAVVQANLSGIFFHFS